MAECRVCGLECDPEIHRATLSIRSYLKADMERRLVRVDLSNKKPRKVKDNQPVLNRPWAQKQERASCQS